MSRNAGICMLALLLLASGCRDSTTSPDVDHDQHDVPNALSVWVPETVVRGEAFPLTVQALAEDGRPDASWSGTVSLSASAGALQPGAVELQSGAVTVQATITGHAGEVTVAARSRTTEGTRSTTVLSGDAPARLEIAPSALLLTPEAATQRLAVHAYDAQGRPTRVQPTWRSSDPAAVAVSSDGVVSAEAALGSAQITAEAEGIVSVPVLAVVAAPVDGAVLVADSQVVGEPAAVDAAAAYGPGWRYTVTLNDFAAPQVGQLLLGTGRAAIGGRVVAVSVAGDEIEVTLEWVPLEDLFDGLRIDESIPLESAEVAVPDEVDAAFDVTRLTGGEFRMESRPGSFAPQDVRVSADDVEFDLGPLKCKAAGKQPSLNFKTVKVSLTQSLVLDIVYDGGLEKLVVRGDVGGSMAYRLGLTAGYEGTVDCEAVYARVILPLGGALSIFAGGAVPVGGGFTLDSKLEVGEVGLDFGVEAGADFELGFACPGGADCRMVNWLDFDANGTVAPAMSMPAARIELGAFAFAFARFDIGHPTLRALQFETLRTRAGLAQSLDVLPPEGQATDPGYASNVRLRLLGEAGAAEDLQKTLSFLKLQIEPTFLRLETPLSRSPAGTFTITPDTVRPANGHVPGDTATFTITLNPVTYAGLYAVDRVELYRLREEGDGGRTLDGGWADCATITPERSGQAVFTCKTDFLEEHIGEQTFYAFVRMGLFGTPFPVPLEIDLDGSATVTVAMPGPRIESITPDTIEVPADGTMRDTFEIRGAGFDGGEVTTTAPLSLIGEPEIDAEGTVIRQAFEVAAGAEAGRFHVFVSTSDGTDSAAVIVRDPPTSYAVTEIGADFESIAARAINDHGQVVGTARSDAVWRAFSWTAEDGIRLLPTVDTVAYKTSHGNGLSDHGLIVGRAYPAGPTHHAVIWTASGGPHDLGTLGGISSEARDINGHGHVVGWSSTEAGSLARAFLWTPEGGMQDLGTLGGTGSRAVAINDQGQIVGHSADAEGRSLAVLWTPGEGMRVLGTLGGRHSSATAINEHGDVAGYSETDEGEWRAFLWTHDEGMQDLGVLEGRASSRAEGISDDGQVVGYSSGSGLTYAFVWSPEHGMRQLPAPGGLSTAASGINVNGQIVGYFPFGHMLLWTPITDDSR